MHRLWNRVRNDAAGEGVISAAIVVLIMAVIGGTMFIVFNDSFGRASDRISDEIDTIVDTPS
jgi:hypothetical protein